MAAYKISRLQVKNFRNLQQNIMDFSPKINCILGENGEGKTNILEAIYFLATKKSFRKNTGFPQFLGMDGEKPEILLSSVFTVDEKKSVSYDGKICAEHSEWILGGKPGRKKLEIPILFINPFDAHGFHIFAEQRRNWFNRHISMLNEKYKSSLKKYRQLLRFRNSLLKEKPSLYREQISALDREMAIHSKILTEERCLFLSEIEHFYGDVFKQIFSEKHSLMAHLETRMKGLSEEEIYDYMQNRFPKDDAAKITTYGVHKDDYAFFLDGLNTLDYGSLGQQKMGYLSLLFAYIRLFRYKMNTFPIVLIDDVSGELDRARWGRLVKYLEKCEFQVLITTANERFKEELEKIMGVNKMRVQSGSVEKIEG